MTERSTKTFNTILKTVALNTCYTLDELDECIYVDEIARSLDFGPEADASSCENPDGELDFGIELGNILPFSNEPASLSVFEFDGKLSLSLVVTLDGYDVTDDERLNAYFASREPWRVITANSDPDMLILEVECDANDLGDIADKTEALLKAALEDGGLASEIDALGNGGDSTDDSFLPF